MKKLSLAFAALLAISLAGTSCRKKEAGPPPPMQQGSPAQPASPHGTMGAVAPKQIVVPEDVKGAWKAVTIEVEFKKEKTRKRFTVPLHSDFRVPTTGLTLNVGVFLPQFSMTRDRITSLSNKPENPACKITVQEKGKDVFHGWLFAKFPTVHPFQHDRVALKLLGGVKK